MNRTKFLSVLFCAVLCVGLVSGCGAQPSASASVSSSVGSSAAERSPSGSQSAAQSAEEPASDTLPGSYPMYFVFASGAGGWGTELNLNADGSFEGLYNDSEMGEQGEGYPQGSVYTCNFSGQFSNIKRLDDHSYSLTLTALTQKGTVGEESIEDEIRFVTAEPFGLESGTDFILYTPDTPLEGLSEDFLTWWPLRYLLYSGDSSSAAASSAPSTLLRYGLLNVDNGYGFFTNE